jgi:hypothetical protein
MADDAKKDLGIKGTKTDDKPSRQLWCAYSTNTESGVTDITDLAVFGREIEALRHGTRNGMHVAPIEYGKSVHAQLLADKK